MLSPGIEQKVAFLSKPETYSDHAACIDVKETHMSWVFLTDKHAWKLKKPVRSEYVDLSTPESRHRNCQREVRVNRQLAPSVYQAVVPLTLDSQGRLHFDGRGPIVDWLVRMRRLPSEQMLDALIVRKAVLMEDISRLSSLLATFYKSARPIPMTGRQYRIRLNADLEAARTELMNPQYCMSRTLVESSIGSQLEFLQQNCELLEARARDGKIVDAHGDLRPEHVCLETPTVVIDRLEFNRNLRVFDAASELAFLALECGALGAPDIGNSILSRYSEITDDRPSGDLIAFYKSYHACVRAKIAIWHLKDENIDGKWRDKARQYLEFAGALRVAA